MGDKHSSLANLKGLVKKGLASDEEFKRQSIISASSASDNDLNYDRCFVTLVRHGTR